MGLEGLKNVNCKMQMLIISQHLAADLAPPKHAFWACTLLVVNSGYRCKCQTVDASNWDLTSFWDVFSKQSSFSMAFSLMQIQTVKVNAETETPLF